MTRAIIIGSAAEAVLAVLHREQRGPKIVATDFGELERRVVAMEDQRMRDTEDRNPEVITGKVYIGDKYVGTATGRMTLTDQPQPRGTVTGRLDSSKTNQSNLPRALQAKAPPAKVLTLHDAYVVFSLCKNGVRPPMDRLSAAIRIYSAAHDAGKNAKERSAHKAKHDFLVTYKKVISGAKK